MLNAEKFRNEILEHVCPCDLFALLKGNKIVKCCEVACTKCYFNGMDGCDFEVMFKWLLSEYKEPVKLTRLESDILEYLSDNTKYMYIVRDGNGDICLYDAEPKKSENGDWWVGRTVHGGMVMFNKLFQFVQWKDSTPTPIKEVLENCEVVEDAEE